MKIGISHDFDQELLGALERILAMFEAESAQTEDFVRVRSPPKAFSPKKKGTGVVFDGWWKWKEDFC